MRKEHQVISFLRQSFEHWTYDYFCTNGATSAVYSDTIGLFSAFFVQNGGIFSIRKRSLTAPLLRELIDHIDVFETEGTGKSRTQRIVIYYRFVGYVEIPEVSQRQHIKADTRKGVAVEYLTEPLPA